MLNPRTSWVAQRLGSHLPLQGTWAWAWYNYRCHAATESMRQSPRSAATEAIARGSQLAATRETRSPRQSRQQLRSSASLLQPEKPARHSRAGSNQDPVPACCNQRDLLATTEQAATEIQCQLAATRETRSPQQSRQQPRSSAAKK